MSFNPGSALTPSHDDPLEDSVLIRLTETAPARVASTSARTTTSGPLPSGSTPTGSAVKMRNGSTLDIYHPIDERVPRVRQLPDSRLMHIKDLYTAQELKTSPTYNEMLLRSGHQDSVNMRLDVSDGSYITWGLADPVASGGWGASRSGWSRGCCPISGNLSASARPWSAPRRSTRR